MTVQEKMHNVSLYLPNDPSIVEEQTRAWKNSMTITRPAPGKGPGARRC